MIYLSEKISLKDLEKEIVRKTIEIGEVNGKKIILNQNISCKKIFSACEQISNDILNQEGIYIPELKNILVFCFMIKNMTNITIKKDKDGNIDIDFIYNLMCSDIGKNINTEFIKLPIYSFLNEEIQKILDFKKEVYIRKISCQNKTFQNIDSLILEFRSVIQKISVFTDEHKNFISSTAFNKIIDALDNRKST